MRIFVLYMFACNSEETTNLKFHLFILIVNFDLYKYCATQILNDVQHSQNILQMVHTSLRMNLLRSKKIDKTLVKIHWSREFAIGTEFVSTRFATSNNSHHFMKYN